MFTTKVDQLLMRPLSAALLASACLYWTGSAYGQTSGNAQGSEGGGQAAETQPAPQAGGGYPPGRPGKGGGPRSGFGGFGQGSGTAGPGGGFGAPGAMPGATTGSVSAPEPDSAAEMLSIALQTNPDLLVARAKVAEAEAELRRVQLDVARRVFRQRQELENQKAKVARIQKLHASKAVSSDELSEAVNELNSLETELQYLMGRSPDGTGVRTSAGMGYPPGFMGIPEIGGTTASGMMPLGRGMSGIPMPGMPGAATMSRNSAVGAGLRTRVGGSASSVEAATGEGKVSKALQAKISLKVENAPLHDVLKKLQEMGEVKFVINTARLSQAGIALDTAVSIDVEDMPLVSVLQLIEDLHPPLSFTYRDYGILVTEGPQSPRESMMNMFWGGARPASR